MLLFSLAANAASMLEKELDEILTKVNSNKNSPNDLLEGSYTYPKEVRFDYTSILTNSLIDSIHKAEQTMLRYNCGGQYIEGELCGIELNPITCAQDEVVYSYETKEITADSAVIYTYPKDGSSSRNKYVLLKDNQGTWKIDGIECGGIGFNLDNDK